jgi:hypothetical protein
MLEPGSLPALSNDETPFIYAGADFPEGGIDIDAAPLSALLADFPADLRLGYKMVMPEEFTVRPDTFDDTDDQADAISALVVLIMPLEFTGEPGAVISIPDSALGNNASTLELFGRTNTNEPVFGDVRIKSAGIRIDFDQTLFRNGYLHIEDELFPNGLNLNSGQNNSLSLNLNADDWEIINSKLIHPHIRVEFPEGTTLRIPRKIIPTKITVAGSMGYTVDLQALGLGN